MTGIDKLKYHGVIEVFTVVECSKEPRELHKYVSSVPKKGFPPNSSVCEPLKTLPPLQEKIIRKKKKRRLVQ